MGEFEVVIASPPYGVSWKGSYNDTRNDKTQPFEYLENVVGVEINFNKVFYGEQRFVTFGLFQGRVIAVVHTENDDLVRIISARKATKYEQQIYFEKV